MDKIKEQLPGLAVGAALGFVLAKVCSCSHSSSCSDRKTTSSKTTDEATAAAARRASAVDIPASAKPTDKVPAASYSHAKPELYILFSAKRAGGKDFTAKRLAKKCLINDPTIGATRISMGDESKAQYCEQEGLGKEGLMRMLGDSAEDRAFKESHRNGITKLYEAKIAEQRDFFHNRSLKKAEATGVKVIMITDARVPFDVDFFAKNAPNVITFRLTADDETRKKRGWVPDEKKDTHITETGLDDKKDWDLCFDSSGNDVAALDKFLSEMAMPLLRKKLGLPEGSPIAAPVDKK